METQVSNSRLKRLTLFFKFAFYFYILSSPEDIVFSLLLEVEEAAGDGGSRERRRERDRDQLVAFSQAP